MAQGKKYEPNDEDRSLALKMAGYCTFEQIAAVLKISSDTLVKYYKEDLDAKKVIVGTQVASKLVEKALRGDNACMMFYLKTQFGWRETTHHELTGKDGAAIQPVLMFGNDAPVDNKDTKASS